MESKLLRSLSLGLNGSIFVSNEIVIDAEPQEVWTVLTDTQSYPQWNPVIPSAIGKFKEGEKIVMLFNDPEQGQYEIRAKIIKVDPGKLINQRGGQWGIITFSHTYRLDSVPEGTKVTIHEAYQGLYLLFWDHTPMAVTYGELNIALKQRVMTLKNQQQ